MQSITKDKNKDTKSGSKRKCLTTALTNEELTERIEGLEGKLQDMEEAMQALIDDILEDYSKPEEEVDSTQGFDSTEL